MREALLIDLQDLRIEVSGRHGERSQPRGQDFQPIAVVRMEEVTEIKSKKQLLAEV